MSRHDPQDPRDAAHDLEYPIAARLEEDFSELAALNQPRMLRLWFDMLGHMLKQEVELKPDTVLPVLTDVLTRLSDKNSVVIYVSPEDIALLQNSLDQEFEEVLRGRSFWPRPPWRPGGSGSRG